MTVYSFSIYLETLQNITLNKLSGSLRVLEVELGKAICRSLVATFDLKVDLSVNASFT